MRTRRWRRSAAALLVLVPALLLSGCSCLIGRVAQVIDDNGVLVALDPSGVELGRSFDGAQSWDLDPPGYVVHPAATFDGSGDPRRSDRGELIVPTEACVGERCWMVDDGVLVERQDGERREVLAPIREAWAAGCGGWDDVVSVMVAESSEGDPIVVASLEGQGIAVRSPDGSWIRNGLGEELPRRGFGYEWPDPFLLLVGPGVIVSTVVAGRFVRAWRRDDGEGARWAASASSRTSWFRVLFFAALNFVVQVVAGGWFNTSGRVPSLITVLLTAGALVPRKGAGRGTPQEVGATVKRGV